MYSTVYSNRKADAHKSVRDLAFRELLVTEILEYAGSHSSASARARPPPSRLQGDLPARLTEGHFPTRIERTPAAIAKGVKHAFRVCKMCPKSATPCQKRKRVETQSWCEPCGVELCIDPCFRLYHTQRDVRI